VSPLLVDVVSAGAAQVAVPVQNPAPPPGQGEEFGKASPVALVVILALALATILLIRGMSKRIRRLPATFDAESDQNGADEKVDKEKAGGEPANGGSA
jgi:hypothetical protein